MKKNVGEIIRCRRLELGMTQKQLANCLYVTDKAVSKWERGICYPDVELLQSISEALNIPIENLTSARFPNITDKKNFKNFCFKVFLSVFVYMILGLLIYCVFFSNPTVLIHVKRIYIFSALIGFNALYFALLKIIIRREPNEHKIG